MLAAYCMLAFCREVDLYFCHGVLDLARKTLLKNNESGDYWHSNSRLVLPYVQGMPHYLKEAKPEEVVSLAASARA